MAFKRTALGIFLTVVLAGALSGFLPGTLRLRAGSSPNPPAPSSKKPRPQAELRALLDAQNAAWNRGDIEAFMAGYWKSEHTTFSGSKGIARGWQALLDRYHRDYPGRAAMGTLTFSNLEITILAPGAALVLGHWHLDRAGGPVGGVFSLVLRKFPEGWRIIHDHTSTVE